jgi:hypothetical protein
MTNLEVTTLRLQLRFQKAYDKLDENGRRTEWYNIGQTIKILKVLSKHGNYALTSNLPDFPNTEDSEIPCLSDIPANANLLAEYFLKIQNSGINYYACLLDNGDDDGGNYGVLFFYKEGNTPFDKLPQESVSECYKKPDEMFLGMVQHKPDYYVAIHTL